MTIMIPPQCVDTCPIAQTLYKELNTQLNDSDRVVQCLLSSEALTGVLLWVKHERQSLFIYLANSIEETIDISVAKQSGLNTFLENDQIAALLELQHALLPSKLHTYRAKLAPMLIINPYDESQQRVVLKTQGLFFFGKSLIKSDALGNIIYKLMGASVSSVVMQQMRSVFSPEVIICSGFDEQSSALGLELEPELDKILNRTLLDDEQELALKVNILSRNQDQYNLTGVIGGFHSGKTEVLIHRAKLIKQLEADSKVIIFTANSASQAAIKKRFEQLNKYLDEPKTHLEIFSFDEWCKQQLRPSEHLIDKTELNKIIKQRLKNHLEANNISAAVFLRELDFIFSRNIFYENDYVSARRFSETDQPETNQLESEQLEEQQLNHIWKALLTLKNELSLRNWLLPSSFSQLLFDKFQVQSPSGLYDYVLVDDIQYLPPIAFDLFKKILKPETGQLFVSQNPAQSITNACYLWEDVKHEFHDRSTHLHQIYQINPAIINAAHAFYLNRLPNQEVLAFLPEKTEAQTLPQLFHFPSKQDEDNRLLNEVNRKIHKGINPKELVIITVTSTEAERLKGLMSETLKTPVELLDEGYYKSHREKNKGLKICTLKQAYGISAPYVYLCGLADLLDTETKISSNENQCHTTLIENTQLLSMAMTRATKELSLFITAAEIPPVFKSPYISTPTAENPNKKTSKVSYLHNSA